MNIGDWVMVANPKLASHGKTGTIKELMYTLPITWIVKLGNGNSISIKECNLKLVNASSELYKDTEVTNDTKYLAFVHYHDMTDNVNNLEEATNTFNEEELGQPEMTVYGTKDEIIKRIKEDPELSSYNHCFVIIGNEVYPVETSVYINW